MATQETMKIIKSYLHYEEGQRVDFAEVVTCPKCGRPGIRFANGIVHEKVKNGVFWVPTDYCIGEKT